jgi:hypothetical protein
MWDNTNRVLLAVFIILLVIAALITDVDAQGGGTCRVTYIKYYSPTCKCYITEARQICTGWTQPRDNRNRFSGGNYSRHGGWH